MTKFPKLGKRYRLRDSRSSANIKQSNCEEYAYQYHGQTAETKDREKILKTFKVTHYI